jgi:hypothetical protein
MQCAQNISLGQVTLGKLLISFHISKTRAQGCMIYNYPVLLKFCIIKEMIHARNVPFGKLSLERDLLSFLVRKHKVPKRLKLYTL